jgi:hypothetical protein
MCWLSPYQVPGMLGSAKQPSNISDELQQELVASGYTGQVLGCGAPKANNKFSQTREFLAADWILQMKSDGTVLARLI